MNIIYQKNFKKPLIKINNIFNGELLWLRDIQYKDSRFDKWKKSLNLFTDNQGVIRSRSRLPKTEKFEFDQRHPVLLPSSNYFTKLLTLYTHDKVCHAGVESTLTKLHKVLDHQRLTNRSKNHQSMCNMLKGSREGITTTTHTSVT